MIEKRFTRDYIKKMNRDIIFSVLMALGVFIIFFGFLYTIFNPDPIYGICCPEFNYKNYPSGYIMRQCFIVGFITLFVGTVGHLYELNKIQERERL